MFYSTNILLIVSDCFFTTNYLSELTTPSHFRARTTFFFPKHIFELLSIVFNSYLLLFGWVTLTHKCQCCPCIETSQLICCANQLTGFYMRAKLAFNACSPCILRHKYRGFIFWFNLLNWVIHIYLLFHVTYVPDDNLRYCK